MNLEKQILKTFSTTFVTYYKSHVSHWNTTGRSFFSDHKLLGKIYDDLFNSVDDLAEIIRTLSILMPTTLGDIIGDSQVLDQPIYDDGDGDEYLAVIQSDLEELVRSYQDLETVSSDLGHNHIQNYCQDRVRVLEKFIWMIRSTLATRNSV